MAISPERPSDDAETCTTSEYHSLKYIYMLVVNKPTQNPHKAYSLPIPGNRLHVLSSKEHWHDINNAPTSQLSPNAASREVREAPLYYMPSYEGIDVSTKIHVSNLIGLLPGSMLVWQLFDRLGI